MTGSADTASAERRPGRKFSPLRESHPELYGFLVRGEHRIFSLGPVLVSLVGWGLFWLLAGFWFTGLLPYADGVWRWVVAALIAFVFPLLQMRWGMAKRARRAWPSIESALRDAGLSDDRALGQIAGDSRLEWVGHAVAVHSPRAPIDAFVAHQGRSMRDEAPELIGRALRLDRRVGMKSISGNLPGILAGILILGRVLLDLPSWVAAQPYLIVAGVVVLGLIVLFAYVRAVFVYLSGMRRLRGELGTYSIDELHAELTALDVAENLRSFLNLPWIGRKRYR